MNVFMTWNYMEERYDGYSILITALNEVWILDIIEKEMKLNWKNQME